MDFSVDQTNEVLSELHRYQKAALKALLHENISLTLEWYLAADAAAHFFRRKKVCELLGSPPSPLIHQLATLMLATQERQKQLESLPQIKSNAHHAADYWISCSQALSSFHLAHFEAIKKECSHTFPTVIPFLQEAEHYFQKTHSTQTKILEQLLAYHWSTIIYDAFFFATSQKVTPLTEEILLVRSRAINAIKAHHYERARVWTLIAFIKENFFKTDGINESLSKKQFLAIKQVAASLEEQLLSRNPDEAWQRSLCWLFVASESHQKGNNQVTNYAIHISKKWQCASHVKMRKKNVFRLALLSQFLFHYWTSAAKKEERSYRSLMKIALLQEITFCLPHQCVPTHAQKKDATRNIIHPALQYTVFYNWIYQTWDLLTKAGIPCQLSTQLPNEGIIITLGHTLPSSFQEKIRSGKIILIDVVADNKPCTAASLHLIQNKEHAEQTANSFFIPHWPQPYLIPRHPERKNRFENICFFGYEKNLARELQSSSWQKHLQEKFGLTFKVKNPSEWHDYSNVDCIIAVRDFSTASHFEKPATKLYNAWLAGVPFIGGSDTAYATDGHPGKDYLIARSLEEVIQHLQHLKENEALRKTLVKEGKKSAIHFTQQATLERWKNLILEVIPKLAIRRLQENNEF